MRSASFALSSAGRPVFWYCGHGDIISEVGLIRVSRLKLGWFLIMSFRTDWPISMILVSDRVVSLREGKPCWRVEKTSPGPRVLRSYLEMVRPSW